MVVKAVMLKKKKNEGHLLWWGGCSCSLPVVVDMWVDVEVSGRRRNNCAAH